MLRNYVNELGLLFLAALIFCAQALFTHPVGQQRTVYVAPPLEIKYLTFGYSSQLADTFWLRAIQDTEYCEQMISEKTCVGKSWLYNVINLTVELDPNFAEAYYYGGLSLTVLIEDIPGATDIFDKGTAKFKHEWPLLYAAAYHALFEQKNPLKASKLYLMAANSGAPPWVRMAAGKLAIQGGDKAAAREILEQMIRSEQDPRWIKQLHEKLEENGPEKQN
jgi:hypothetical protein